MGVTRLRPGLGPNRARGGGAGGGGFGGGRGGGGGDVPLTVAGEATGEFNSGGPAQIRGSILMVDGILYPTSPDNLWAVDARDGTILWQFYWKTRGGTHTGHRGVGMWRNYLFMETHDNYLVKIDARTGKEVWHVEIAPFEQQYFSSMAPVIIGDHVIAGTGNDLDAPGYLQSFDPETGKRQWIFYTVPMNPGDPGLETWPSLEAARHGGGQPWVPGVYDPETRLYIFGTGNPTPAYTVAGRGTGVGLFTCSLIAVNVDTGKMAWYYQTSPRDMHDWDSAQTPVLIDGTINGRPRKLVSTAARNGYFFTVDRVTGEYVASGKFGTATNWASGLDPQGRPILNPEKVSTIPGAIVSGSITNWPPPAYSPDTGLFYVPENNGVVDHLSHRRGSARLDGARRPTDRRRRVARQLHHGHRCKDGESGVAAQIDRRRRCDRHADDGWTAAVFRRRFGQPRRVRSGGRPAAVALANRERLERASDLRTGRQAVSARCRR